MIPISTINTSSAKPTDCLVQAIVETWLYDVHQNNKAWQGKKHEQTITQTLFNQKFPPSNKDTGPQNVCYQAAKEKNFYSCI